MRALIDGLVEAAQREGMEKAVVTITAHVEAGSPRASITALVRQEILDRL